MSLSVYLRCLHHPSFHCGHKELSKRKSFLFRIPDSVSLLWNTEQTLHHAFWYYYDYLWANEFTPPPPWFVNTCVCTVLLWALDTGKETYIVFMKMKKKKSQMLKKKKSVIIKKKKLMSSWMCQLFFVKMYSIRFGKALTTVALSCCDGQTTENMKHKVCLSVERGGRKSQNERVLAPGRMPRPDRDPCTHVVR